ncbi:MAG TPA: MmcB family DNA repair protein [Rhizomicrobium sp.]|nr:MmcB family DNA repair protein [Rhizomicrobium sp.]
MTGSFPKCSNASMPVTAQDVARGVSRLLLQEGYSPILEFTLANGRRLDVAALGADGTVMGVEIKVAVGDLKQDVKWPDYLEFCELFYFAIPPDFPDELVPPDTGLIVADKYGGAIVRPSPVASIHASRRKAVTLRFAKVAAERLNMALDLAADAARILGDTHE